MQKIVPFLWYKDNKAEEAANFYVSIIRGSKITEICGQERPVRGQWDQ